MAKWEDKPNCQVCGGKEYMAPGDRLCGTCLAKADKREKLRDQAANAALTGMLAREALLDKMPSGKTVAEVAYEYADAMLAERENIHVKKGVMTPTTASHEEVGIISFDGPGGTKITGRVVGEDGGDWILDCGEEMGLIRRSKQKRHKREGPA